MDEFIVLNLDEYREIRDSKPDPPEDDSFEDAQPSRLVDKLEQSESKKVLETDLNDTVSDINNGDSENLAEPVLAAEPNIPEGVNKKGLPLYHFLRKFSPDIDWNSNNEILISGSLIPNSNILQLIRDATENEAGIVSEDATWRVFRNWLRAHNVPSGIVNDRVNRKKDPPQVINPVDPTTFPSISTLKEREKKGLGPVVHRNIETSVENVPIVESDDPENKKLDEKVEKKPTRVSTRVKVAPKIYGRGRNKAKNTTSNIKRTILKWKKF